MNRTYNIVWSYTRQAWVVASELASSSGRPPLAKKRALSAMILLGIIAGQSVEAASTPDDVSAGQVVTGDVISGRIQYVSSGGSAISTIIDDEGIQGVSSGGNVISTVINSGGRLNIDSGGSATNTIVNSKGLYYVTGGNATSTTVNGGTQFIFSGGSATSSIVNSEGQQRILSLGAATDTEVNNRGAQSILSGGSATSTIVNSGGKQDINFGGTVTSTTVNSGGTQNIWYRGSATSTEVNSGGTQNISAGGSAADSIINVSGTQNISSGGSATSTTVNSGGMQNISAGGSATDSIINVSGTQNISSGGSATSTEINSGGIQNISAGGSATDSIINVSGIQFVSSGGSATSTEVNSGGIQNISAGGSATDSIINANGTQNISSGGSATSTVINSLGHQFIHSGGNVTSTVVSSGGTQNISAGGSAVDTVIDRGGVQGVTGVAIGTHIYGGTQNVDGVATRTIIDGGSQNIVAGGSATDTEVSNNGTQWVISGGSVTGTVVNFKGLQDISGGAATSITVNDGGRQNVYSGGSATNTTVNSRGQQDILSGGAATSTTLNSEGYQNIYSGGSAAHTTLNSVGRQHISSGGSATSTTINDGWQYIYSGGSATNTTINGGRQNVYSGGSAINTAINSGGMQVISGGSATSTTINGGVQDIGYSGSATNTEVNSGGTQRVNYYGVISGTIIHSGGQTILLDGSTVDKGILPNDGLLIVNPQSSYVLDGVTVQGNGALQKTGTGVLTLTNDDITLNGGISLLEGELVIDSSKTSANIITQKDTALTLAVGRTLTGNIDNGGRTVLGNNAQIAGKVINAGTLMLNDSSAAISATVSGSVDNSGTMIIGTSAGNTGSVLNIGGDYTGNDGKLMLNSVLSNDSSPTDKLLIGGDATGRTDIIVNNLGGKGDQTVDGIEIVRVGGTSDTGAFYNSKAIRAGLYNYTVVRKDNNNFYLTSDYVVPGSTKPATGGNSVVITAPDTKPATGDNPVVITTPDTKPATGGNPVVMPELFSLSVMWDLGKDISTAAGGYIANLAAANQAFVTRLADREGGSEYINPVTGQRDITRLWLRQEGGHNRSRADVLRTTSNRYVAQLGGELINGSFTDTDHWDLGLMAGYVNQQGTTTSLHSRYNANTKSQLHGYSTGLYGTWYQDAEAQTGLYVGTWAQYSWFHNSVNEDGQASDSYKSKGFSASLETGYSWKVIDGERTDFFIQPQAQLVWSGIKADDHDTDTGTRVQGEGGNNLQSSLGVKAYLKGHSELDDNTGRSFKPFVEANWIHNTARYGVRMDGDSLNQDGAKDIVEVKTGVESRLSANTSIWGGVGVQIGDKGYSDTQGQLGLKVRF